MGAFRARFVRPDKPGSLASTPDPRPSPESGCHRALLPSRDVDALRFGAIHGIHHRLAVLACERPVFAHQSRWRSALGLRRHSGERGTREYRPETVANVVANERECAID